MKIKRKYRSGHMVGAGTARYTGKWWNRFVLVFNDFDLLLIRFKWFDIEFERS